MVLLIMLNIKAPSHLPLDTLLADNNYKFIMAYKFSGVSKSHLPLYVLASKVSRFKQINLHSSFSSIFYHGLQFVFWIPVNFLSWSSICILVDFEHTNNDD